MDNPIWGIPNFWNTALSGFLVVLIPTIARFFLIRPKLIVSSHEDPIPSFEKISTNDPLLNKKVLYKQIDNYKLGVQNKGLATLNHPRVWCLAAKIRTNNKLTNLPLSPFELNWSDTDKDLQIGAVFPGNFNYTINFLNLEKGISSSDSEEANPSDPFQGKAYIPRRDSNDNKLLFLDPELVYEICLIISNDNFLVPAHFIHLQIDWRNTNKLRIRVKNQKDMFVAQSLGETMIFEWNA